MFRVMECDAGTRHTSKCKYTCVFVKTHTHTHLMTTNLTYTHICHHTGRKARRVCVCLRVRVGDYLFGKPTPIILLLESEEEREQACC